MDLLGRATPPWQVRFSERVEQLFLIVHESKRNWLFIYSINRSSFFYPSLKSYLPNSRLYTPILRHGFYLFVAVLSLYLTMGNRKESYIISYRYYR